VAAAVGEDLRYVKVRQGDEVYWLGRGTVKHALEGPFQVLEERPGRELEGWRYAGPFDELPASRPPSQARTASLPTSTAWLSGTRWVRRRAPASST